MACEGELLVLQREHEDLEAALGLVAVPLVRTVQRLFQGELRSIFSHFFVFRPRTTYALFPEGLNFLT